MSIAQQLHTCVNVYTTIHSNLKIILSVNLNSNVHYFINQ